MIKIDSNYKNEQHTKTQVSIEGDKLKIFFEATAILEEVINILENSVGLDEYLVRILVLAISDEGLSKNNKDNTETDNTGTDGKKVIDFLEVIKNKL